jgi:hypothetical protein
VVAHRDGSGASRLRVAPWLPSTRSPQPGDRVDPDPGTGPVSAEERPDVAVIAGLEPILPDQPAQAASLLHPVPLDRAGRRRGRWWFVVVPAVAIALVVAVALQLRDGPAPWRPPLPQMSPQVVLPELSQSPSAGAPSGSGSPSASRRPSTTPSTSGGPGAGQRTPGGTPTATPAPAVQPGSIVGSDGRCMEPEGSGRGSFIRVATCANVSKQRWSAGGDSTLRSLGFCLDLFLEDRSEGTPVALSSCDGSSSQRWRLDGGRWRNDRSNRCLTAGGGRLTIEDCGSGANQRWSLT